jgi:hypothetical protein
MTETSVNRIDHYYFSPYEGPPNTSVPTGPGGVHSWYYSNPYPVATAPTALAQLNVLPYTVLYYPPGNKSQPTLASGAAFQDTFTIASTQEQMNTASLDIKTGVSTTLGGAFTVDDVAVPFKFNVDARWDTTTETVNTTTNQDQTQATNLTSSSITLVGACATACEPPDNTWAGQNLFWNDSIIAYLNPQFAVWDTVMCANGQPPNGTDCGSNAVDMRTSYECPIAVSSTFPAPCGSDQTSNSQFIPCYNGTTALQLAAVPPCPASTPTSSAPTPPARVALAGALATQLVSAEPLSLIRLPIWQLFEVCAAPDVSWSPASIPAGPITLQPNDCWSLINLDPFAAGQGQSTPIDPSRENDVGSAINFGASCPGATMTGDTVTIPLPCNVSGVTLGENWQFMGTTVTTGTVDYETSVTSSATLSTGASIGIGDFGLGATASETALSKNSVKFTYQTSQSILNQSSLSSSVLLEDTNIPLSTAIWLDQIFGSYMFPDPTAPPISLSAMASTVMTSARAKAFTTAHPDLSAITLTATSGGWNPRPAKSPLPGRNQNPPWTASSAGARLRGTFTEPFVAIESHVSGSQFKVSIDGGPSTATIPVPPMVLPQTITSPASTLVPTWVSIVYQKELQGTAQHTIDIIAVSANSELDAALVAKQTVKLP